MEPKKSNPKELVDCLISESYISGLNNLGLSNKRDRDVLVRAVQVHQRILRTIFFSRMCAIDKAYKNLKILSDTDRANKFRFTRGKKLSTVSFGPTPPSPII